VAKKLAHFVLYASTSSNIDRFSNLFHCQNQENISYGSVATHLRCGGIFRDSIITNVLLIQTVNKFENRSIFDEVMANKVKAFKNCASFLGHPVYYCRSLPL